MAYRMHRAFIGPFSVVVLMLAANQTFAQSGMAAARGGVASTHSISRPFVGHHRRPNAGPFWPATGGFFYGPSYGQPMVDATQPISSDVRYTYTYDVPWDWSHRYPPMVVPSDRPYVSSCSSETVTVPGRNGQQQTVNVMRCY